LTGRPSKQWHPARKDATLSPAAKAFEHAVHVGGDAIPKGTKNASIITRQVKAALKSQMKRFTT
jgi:hypothetical protein